MSAKDADVQYQAELIVARKQFWTQDTEKLLRKWKGQIARRCIGHKISEGKYTKIYYGIGLPAAILSAISASGILTTFQNCNECPNVNSSSASSSTSSSTCNSEEYIRLVMGLVGMIAAVLSAIFLFIDAGGMKRDHKDAVSDCESLSRDIEEILIQPIVQRGDPISQLQRIRNRFDIIVQNSPSIPSEYQKNLDYVSLEKHGHHLRPPRPNIDLTKIHHRKKIPDTSVLAEILANQVHKTKEKVASAAEEVRKFNDHDTDEEKDVVIPFDPETFRPDDMPGDPIKESLQRALEFELTRFGGSTMEPEDIHIDVEKMKDEDDED
jgi:hypothetical protein